MGILAKEGDLVHDPLQPVHFDCLNVHAVGISQRIEHVVLLKRSLVPPEYQVNPVIEMSAHIVAK